MAQSLERLPGCTKQPADTIEKLRKKKGAHKMPFFFMFLNNFLIEKSGVNTSS